MEMPLSKVEVRAVKAKIRNHDAANLKKLLGMTHAEFAKLLGISKSLSEAWANGNRYPTGAAYTLICLMWSDDVIFARAKEKRILVDYLKTVEKKDADAEKAIL